MEENEKRLKRNTIIITTAVVIVCLVAILNSKFYCYSYDKETLGEVHTKYETCNQE